MTRYGFIGQNQKICLLRFQRFINWNRGPVTGGCYILFYFYFYFCDELRNSKNRLSAQNEHACVSEYVCLYVRSWKREIKRFIMLLKNKKIKKNSLIIIDKTCLWILYSTVFTMHENEFSELLVSYLGHSELQLW